MAGDWIKIEHWTPDKPEVFRMSEILKIDPDAVSGKLLRIWIWADQQTVTGDAASVTFASLDRLASVTGFAHAMIQCGWLEKTDIGLRFVNFDRHNGETAKKRAETAKRNSALRSRRHERDANVTLRASRTRHVSVTSASPKEEKRREEKKSKNPPTPFQGVGAAAANPPPVESGSTDLVAEISGSALEFVRDSWNASGPTTCLRLSDKLRASARARLKIPWWSEHWLLALERLPSCRFLWGENERGWKADLEWFLKPDSVQKILEGKYDHVGTTAASTENREQAAYNRSIEALAKFAQSDESGGQPGSGAPLCLEEDGSF